jgi:hypothetical protein
MDNLNVTNVMVSVTHPSYPDQHEELKVEPVDETVMLRHGTDLVVSAHVTGSDQEVTGLTVKVDSDSGAGTDWQKPDDTHIHNVKIRAGARVLYGWATVGGRTYYSAMVPVTVAEGERKELSLELRPGIHVSGQLSTNVPRPIVNGTLRWEMPNTETKRIRDGWAKVPQPLDLSHGDTAQIQADGSFDLGVQPEGVIEIAALCNGWRNKDGPSLRENKFDRSVTPQVFHLDSSHQGVVLEMEPTAGFKATLLKPTGEPLSGATVYFSSNIFFLNYSTTSLRVDGCSGVTDGAGNVSIVDLPADNHGWLTMFAPGDAWELPADLKKAKIVLEPGKITQMEIRVVAKAPSVPAQH